MQFLILCLVIAAAAASPIIHHASPIYPYSSPYSSPYYAPAAVKYAAAPLVHHPAPYYAPYALPYHAAAPAPIVKAIAPVPLAQSYTSFSQVVTHPQPIVKVHAEPVHYPVHYDPAPLKYTAAPLIRAAYAHHY